MPEDAAREWWWRWLEAEIARSEDALIAAPDCDKFEIWRRLDLLHALGSDAAPDGRRRRRG